MRKLLWPAGATLWHARAQALLQPSLCIVPSEALDLGPRAIKVSRDGALPDSIDRLEAT